MKNTEQLVESVIIMLLLIVITTILKKVGFLQKKDSTLTSKLVLKITLPSLILTSLSSQTFNYQTLTVVAIVMAAEICCLVLAWVGARLLKLSPGETGALMLVSAFGMSTMLGYPLIEQTFLGNERAMEDAVIISELGVGILLFLLAPIIAMTFGDSHFKRKDVIVSVKSFFISPIFISIILGIALSFIKLPESNPIISVVYKILNLFGAANLFLVGITIGLLIEFKGVQKFSGFLIMAILIKLVIQPLITYYGLSITNFETLIKEVATIETAMPSAILVAIFAKNYNCKPELVSTTILVTLIISLISVTVLFGIIF